MKSQFFLPIAVGRIAFSTQLLSISTSPLPEGYSQMLWMKT
jgi:hypothetical protein